MQDHVLTKPQYNFDIVYDLVVDCLEIFDSQLAQARIDYSAGSEELVFQVQPFVTTEENEICQF